MTTTTDKPDLYETSGTSPPETSISAADDVDTDTPLQPRKHNYVREGFQNRTRGEKKFNITTYFGLGYVGVWAFSLFASWLFRDSKWVSPHYENGVQAITRGVASATGKNYDQLLTPVRKYANIASLFVGGTLVSIIPIKWREDHKHEIVKKYDEEIYGKFATENDPIIKAAHEEIRTAPQQTWLSVFASRFTSFVVTFTSAALIGNNIEKISTHFGRNVASRFSDAAKAQTQIAKAVPKYENALLTEPKNLQADHVYARIGHDAAADGMYTVLTSGALYVFTRVFAPFFDKRDRITGQPQTREAKHHQPIAKNAHIPANNNHREAENDNDLATPKAQVNAVQAQARVAAPPREASVTA